jgi:hypothetical protein
MKTTLCVPFADFVKVKALGARFDMGRKVWYVPDGVDIYPFLIWVPNVSLCERTIEAMKRGR